MNFNEFNRRMSHTNLNEDGRYLLAHVFETQLEVIKQLNTCTTLINALVESVQNVVNLHGDTQNKVKQLMEFGRTPGVEVHSVRNDPDDDPTH